MKHLTQRKGIWKVCVWLCPGSSWGHPEILSESSKERRFVAVIHVAKQRECAYFLTICVFQDHRAWVKPNVVREPNNPFFSSLWLSFKAGSVPGVHQEKASLGVSVSHDLLAKLLQPSQAVHKDVFGRDARTWVGRPCFQGEGSPWEYTCSPPADS